MHLEPKQLIRIASPFDGTVKALLRKPGQKVDTATEILRMDLTPKQLLLDRAKALYRAAQLEAEAAGKGGTGSDPSIAKQLAEARLEAAKADLDLAAYWVEQGTLRAPFPAEVFGVSIAEGQVVRMGEPLIVLGDTSALTVEIPVDRASTQVGQNLTIKVEDQTASAKVEALLPLSARFEPLRDLLPSAALASVVVKNSGGTLKAGQTVYSPLVPRDLIADVPNGCIGNVGDGGHKVQVLRDNTVRDVVVATLAPVGVERSFVSGAFRDGDEVIESSSQELVDGTVVRSSPMAFVKQTAGKANGARSSRPHRREAGGRENRRATESNEQGWQARGPVISPPVLCAGDCPTPLYLNKAGIIPFQMGRILAMGVGPDILAIHETVPCKFNNRARVRSSALADEIIIDDYQLINHISTGGSTQVWEATDKGGGGERRYAMKVMLPEALLQSEQRSVLKHEAKLAEKFDHVNLVRFYKLVLNKKRGYIVMEYFRAPNLKTQLQNEMISVQARLPRLIEQICSVLGYLHGQGWVHRDIKPDNILFNKASELRLIDFSLTTRAAGAVAKMLGSKQGSIQGTRTYIPPEAILKAPVTPQSDIYSLGITLFEVLTGEPPYKGTSPDDLLKKHLTGQIPEPSAFNPNVTPELDRMITKMLSKKAAKRQKDTHEVLAEFRNLKPFKEDVIEVDRRRKVAEAERYKTTLDKAGRLDSRADHERQQYLRANPGVATDLDKKAPAKVVVIPAGKQAGTRESDGSCPAKPTALRPLPQRRSPRALNSPRPSSRLNSPPVPSSRCRNTRSNR